MTEQGDYQETPKPEEVRVYRLVPGNFRECGMKEEIIEVHPKRQISEGRVVSRGSLAVDFVGFNGREWLYETTMVSMQHEINPGKDAHPVLRFLFNSNTNRLSIDQWFGLKTSNLPGLEEIPSE